MRVEWEPNAMISVRNECGAVIISANRAGLLSLAGQFKALAEEMPGTHLHYDEFNAFEEASNEMIVELVQ